jgi:hypothetical protein
VIPIKRRNAAYAGGAGVRARSSMHQMPLLIIRAAALIMAMALNDSIQIASIGLMRWFVGWYFTT